MLKILFHSIPKKCLFQNFQSYHFVKKQFFVVCEFSWTNSKISFWNLFPIFYCRYVKQSIFFNDKKLIISVFHSYSRVFWLKWLRKSNKCERKNYRNNFFRLEMCINHSKSILIEIIRVYSKSWIYFSFIGQKWRYLSISNFSRTKLWEEYFRPF